MIRHLPALLLSCVVLFACSKGGGAVDANVSCKGSNDSIDCTVTHKSGTQGANVCWGLKFTCQNGTIATADNLCQPVQAGQASQKRIPITQLKNFDKCDKALSTEVVGMKLSAL